MMVISRMKDESIMIGDDIEITILDIRGDKVRICINAPKPIPIHRKEIPIHRKEIYEVIQRQRKKEKS